MKKIYVSCRTTFLLLVLSFLTIFCCPLTARSQTYATSQVNGVTGLCLLCGVSNPANPVNNSNLTDYSTFNITVGLLGVTIYQTLIFPNASSAGCDSLIIAFGSANSALSINLVSGVSVQTFNGATANNDLQALDSSNVVLTGANTGQIILRPSQIFDRVKITLSSSLVGLLSGFRLYYALFKPSIASPVLEDSVRICSKDTALLNATAPTGTTLEWFSSAAGGTPLFIGNNYKVSPSITTTYYAAAIKGGCSSYLLPVTVVVNPLPQDPTYTVPEGRQCGNVNLIMSNYVPGTNYNVSVNYTGSGNLNFDTSYIVANSNTVTVRDLNDYFNATARVSIQAMNSLTGCRSDTVTQEFIFGGHAAPVVVTGDSIVICKGDSGILNANLYNDPNGTKLAIIRWYDSAENGNLLFTGHNFTVSPDTTTTYYVTAAYECNYPVRTPARAVVRKAPNPQFTVPEGVACGVQHITVQNYQPGFSYYIKVVYRSFEGVYADTSYLISGSSQIVTPSIFPLLPVDVDLFVVTKDSVTGCRSDTVHQIYSMGGASAQPAVYQDSVSICSGDTAILQAYVPNLSDTTIRYAWYDAPTGGNLLATGSIFKVSPSVTTTYYAASGYECQYPVRAAAVVTVKECSNSRSDTAFNRGTQPSGLTGNTPSISVFPNPNKGLLMINSNMDLAGSILIVYNVNGVEVQRETLISNQVVLKMHTPGNYYIRLIIPGITNVPVQRIIYQP